MTQLGAFRIDLISDGIFEDDADSFVQPCVEKESAAKLKARVKTRIKVGFNCLLVRAGGHTVVIDPGTGDKPRPDKVSHYRMEWPRRFFSTLEELDVRREEVNTVILTHLHWDHAGAATRLVHGRAEPSFPNARYFVQKKELEAAQAENAAGEKDSYLPEDYEPLLRAGCLTVIDGDVELFPGISCRWVGGHSAGLQVVMVGSGTSRAIYLSDLVPTTTQIPLDCMLSYDQDHAQLKESKQKILAEAEEHRDLLLFVHAPRVRAGRLKRRADNTLSLESVHI
jgi:glyoxylase-like metal-dependent hydrolase (beta-lactamase superfamily II)